MQKKNNYIVVNKNLPTISQVINDCTEDLCFPTYKGESLASILKKLCSHIKAKKLTCIEAGDNIDITGSGDCDTDPYVINADISHVHGIANYLGLRQFAFGVEENVRIEGTGGTTISFDSFTKKIIIHSESTGSGPEDDPVAMNAPITIHQGDGINVIGIDTQTLSDPPSWTIEHGDTSDITDQTYTGAEVPASFTYDQFGHTLTAGKRTLTLADIGGIYTLDTVTVDLSGNGTEADPLYADVNVSQEPNNSIVIMGDGLYSPTLIQNGLIYGGVITWISGLTFHVTAAGYYINGVFYQSPAVDIILDSADPAEDRFDTFVVDITSNAVALTGVPSPTPAEPGVDFQTQIRLGSVLIPAGAIEPGLDYECIYQEGDIWTNTVSTVGFNRASASNPCQGTLTIEGTGLTDSGLLKWTRPGGIFDPNDDFTVVTFYILPKPGFPTTRNIFLRWWDGGTPVGVPVIVSHGGIYGFDALNTNCQLISIPLSHFNIILGTDVDSLMIGTGGTGATFGFYLDAICLQDIEIPPPAPTAEDIKVKVSANDTTTGYLTEKLIAGSGIVMAEVNDGGDEDYRISHADTSSVTDITYTGAEVPSFETYDAFGHTLTSGKRTLTLADLGYTPIDVSGQNAIHEVSTDVFEWGFNPLLHDTTITHAGFKVTYTGTRNGNLVEVLNANTNPSAVALFAQSPVIGVYGSSTTGLGVLGVTGTNIGVSGSASGTGTGVQGTSSSGVAGVFTIATPNSLGANNTFRKTLEINRSTLGTPANGIGSYIGFNGVTSTFSNAEMGRIGFLWTDVTNASTDSRFELWTADNVTVARKFAVTSVGQLIADKYGDGLFAAPPTYLLGSDVNGNIVEILASSVGADTNFATTDLTATGHRNHTWGAYSYDQNFAPAAGGNMVFTITPLSRQILMTSYDGTNYSGTLQINHQLVLLQATSATNVTTASIAAQENGAILSFLEQGVTDRDTHLTMNSAGVTIEKQVATTDVNVDLPLFIKKLPLLSTSYTLYYNPTTGQVTYNTASGGSDGNDYVDGVSFNTSDGVLTLTRTGALADLTVDLDGRYLTSYTETDPVFTASPAFGITNTDISNWNEAYDNYPTGVSFTGTGTKTIHITLRDGSELTASFTDLTTSGGSGLTDAYISMTDGTNVSSAVTGDTFKFRSANNLLSVLVANDDPTHGDNLLLTVSAANIRALFSAGTGIGYDNTTGVITNSDLGSSQNIFKNIAVATQTTIVADSNNDTLTVVAGTGISLTTDATTDTLTITNSAPDQTVVLTSGTGISVTGTYPNFNIATTITQYTDEMAQDTVATLIQNGTGITWSYNDALNTLTPTVTITQYTDELAQDAIGAAIAAGTHTGLTITYNDASNLFSFTNTDLGSSQNIFKNIAVATQTTIVADSNNDTLTVVAGTGIGLTTDATTDTLTITNSDPDKNFAEDDLTFSGNRIHELGAFDLTIRRNANNYWKIGSNFFQTNSNDTTTATKTAGSYFSATATTAQAIISTGYASGAAAVSAYSDATTNYVSLNSSSGKFYVSTLPTSASGTDHMVVWDDATQLLGYRTIPTQYTDEMAQDAVYGILTADNGLTGTYNDAGNAYSLQLGGTLTHNTSISGNFHMLWGDFVPLASMQIYSGTFSVNTSGSVTVSGATDTIIRGGSSIRIGAVSDAYISVDSAEMVSSQAYDSGYKMLVWNATNKHMKVATWFNPSTIITTETDPIATAKTVTLTAGAGISITGAAQTVGANPAFTITSTITQYTDELAQDAVGSILTDSSSVDFTYDDGANTVTAIVKTDWLYDRVRVLEAQFDVGDVDMPVAGDTVFTLQDCNGDTITNAAIVVYIERLRMIRTRDYTFNSSTGVVTLVNPLIDSQTVVIEVHPENILLQCTVGGGAPVGGFDYDFDFDIGA